MGRAFDSEAFAAAKANLWLKKLKFTHSRT